MVAFSSNEFSIDNLITLVSHEAVYRLDDMLQVDALRNWVGSALTLGAAVVVVGAFENEAHALGHKTNVTALPPAHEEEGQLSKTVIVAHVVHGIPPTIQRAVQGFAA